MKSTPRSIGGQCLHQMVVGWSRRPTGPTALLVPPTNKKAALAGGLFTGNRRKLEVELHRRLVLARRAVEVQTVLHLEVGVPGEVVAYVRAGPACGHGELALVRGGDEPIGFVEHVEDLADQLNFETLRQSEPLGQAQVEVGEIRLILGIAPRMCAPRSSGSSRTLPGWSCWPE